MYKILLWGAGRRTEYYIKKNLLGDNCDVVAIVDSYADKSEYLGYKIIQPSSLANCIDNIDFVVICNQFYRDILKQITDLGLEWRKIIITDRNDDYPYNEMYQRGRKVIPQVCELNDRCIQKAIVMNERDTIDNNAFNKVDRFSEPEFTKDYFRFRTFDFVAEQINSRKLIGSVAELGVFRGDFSALINYRFPDRKIYLFDTFEGFGDKEAEKELDKGRATEQFIDYHKDTSVEKMLENLPHPEKAVVCKGYFPDTLTKESIDDKYVFVSIDVDFEESTFEGLKFFYPRMIEGGYIFIHDYNTYFLEGIREAVNRYEEYIGERLRVVPIADRAGTLIILK